MYIPSTNLLIVTSVVAIISTCIDNIYGSHFPYRTNGDSRNLIRREAVGHTIGDIDIVWLDIKTSDESNLFDPVTEEQIDNAINDTTAFFIENSGNQQRLH